MLPEMMRWIDEWWTVHRGIVRLKSFDDRLLADIGIERDEIPRFVRGQLRSDVLVDKTAPAFTIGSPHPRVPRCGQVARMVGQLPTSQRQRVQL